MMNYLNIFLILEVVFEATVSRGNMDLRFLLRQMRSGDMTAMLTCAAIVVLSVVGAAVAVCDRTVRPGFMPVCILLMWLAAYIMQPQGVYALICKVSYEETSIVFRAIDSLPRAIRFGAIPGCIHYLTALSALVVNTVRSKCK